MSKKYILGISCFYHDSASALICNGEIVSASQEERFTRKKHDSRFPKNSIKYSLRSQNIDLKDARTVLKDSGTAIMGSGSASGENRAQEAIINALDSPLLNDNKISGCKNVLLLIVSGSEEITIDEIGSINDYIQEEAGNNANIIMGVGEDENIGSSIAVTIIATGFGSDQQNQIVNTEAKKIIHTLEDDQPIEQFLMGETSEIKGFDSPIDMDHDKSIKTKVDLEEDNSVIFHEGKKNDFDSDGISMKPIPQEVFDIPVISERINIDEIDIEKESESLSSDEINNLEVVYEILEFNSTEDQLLEIEEVSEVTHHDFIINNLSNDILDMEIVDEVVISADEDSEKQFTFDFALTKNLNEIDVGKVINKLDNIENPVEDKAINEAMDFKFEIDEKSEKSELLDLSIENENLKSESPFDKSIQESVTSENENRKEHLKKFNHSFKHSLSKIDEFEKQPAYKRMGLDLEQHSSSDSDESRISLDKDKNDDIQLRTNNSFLHDNVD